MSILPIDGFISANGLQLHYRGINCCPNSLTNLDTACSRRLSPCSLDTWHRQWQSGERPGAPHLR